MPRVATFKVPHEAEDGTTVQWTYKCGMPPVMVQHEILRRVAPAIASRAAPAVAAAGGKLTKGVGVEIVGQMVAALSDIKREDHDWVIDQLMRGVQVQRTVSGPWADIWNSGVPFDQAMMFTDFSLKEFYDVLLEVVEHTYGNFMVALFPTLSVAPPEA